MTVFRFSFWNLSLLVGLLVVSSFLWLDSHLGYRTEGVVLVQSAGSEACITETESATTVASFAKTGQFVKRTISSTRLQSSGFSELTEEQQIAFLVKNVAVESGSEGALIRVITKDRDLERSILVNEESIETLIRMTAVYYAGDIAQTVRVIDAPTGKRALLNPLLYAIKSGLSAILLFLVIELIYSVISFGKRRVKKISKNNLDQSGAEIESTKNMFVPQKVDPKFLSGTFTEEVKEENSQEETEDKKLPKASKSINEKVYGSYKGGGLASVSVSMQDLPFSFEGDNSSQQTEALVQEEEEHPLEAYIQSQENKEVVEAVEPSVLEYKKRLNELLAQK